jgi:hypothetical protein
MIRPDGYIGFRGSVSDRAKLDAFLRRTLVGGSR